MCAKITKGNYYKIYIGLYLKMKTITNKNDQNTQQNYRNLQKLKLK